MGGGGGCLSWIHCANCHISQKGWQKLCSATRRVASPRPMKDGQVLLQCATSHITLYEEGIIIHNNKLGGTVNILVAFRVSPTRRDLLKVPRFQSGCPSLKPRTLAMKKIILQFHSCMVSKEMLTAR